MTAGVRIAESRRNATAFGLAAQLLGNGLPLSWRCLQTDVTVGGYASSVHDDTHTTLMSLGVEIAEGHHVGAAGIEVTVGIQLKGLCLTGCPHRQQHD